MACSRSHIQHVLDPGFGSGDICLQTPVPWPPLPHHVPPWALPFGNLLSFQGTVRSYIKRDQILHINHIWDHYRRIKTERISQSRLCELLAAMLQTVSGKETPRWFISDVFQNHIHTRKEICWHVLPHLPFGVLSSQTRLHCYIIVLPAPSFPATSLGIFMTHTSVG